MIPLSLPRSVSGARSTALRLARACAIAAVLAAPARAQGTTWNEAWVGSEAEVYLRAHSIRDTAHGLWSIRPLAPRVLRGGARNAPTTHAWAARLPGGDSLPPVAVLRPSLTSSYNSAYAWGRDDAAVWQGRGVNAWVTAGIGAAWGPLTLRVEPMVWHSGNRAFELRPSPYASEFSAPIAGIDLPQRLGPASVTEWTPGQSFIRADAGPVAIALSSANIAWGAGVRHGLLFGANAAGFPHVAIGTNGPLSTPVGAIALQMVYASLSQTEWAPPTENERRFGTGVIIAWQPAGSAFEVGAARFYHRPWPATFGLGDLGSPFGSAFRDDEVAGTGGADNQLASIFATLRMRDLGVELFGEFGRNDRSSDLRDIAVEPEHNAAWLLGAMHATVPNPETHAFWTTRLEVVNARITRITTIGRGQAPYYSHSSVVQGHTQLGQLLGTPLAEQSGGLELAIDRWAPWGRVGGSLMERQLPGDAALGMPADAARSQWELATSATVFHGSADLHAQAGYVWDFNRFAGRDMGNFHLRVGIRSGVPGLLSR